MTAPLNFYADPAAFTSLKKEASQQDPKALREAARQFESLFTQMMLKSMRDASKSFRSAESLTDSDQTDFYREMFDNQMAVQLSKGKGLGLADILVRQLQGGLGANNAAEKANGIDSQHLRLAPPPQPSQSTSAWGSPANTSTSWRSAGPTTRSVLSESHPAAPLAAQGRGQNEVAPQHSQSDSLPISPVERGRAGWEQLPSVLTGEVDTSSATEVINGNDILADGSLAIDHSANAPLADHRSLITDHTSSSRSASRVPRHEPAASQRSLASTPEDFISQLWPHAEAAGRELGVDPKTLIAHAALETGWGKSVPCNPDGSCSFNLFGIKAGAGWRGSAVGVSTLEYQDGVAVRQRASFRAYDSAADSFRDYAALIRHSPRYAAAIGSGSDAAAFANALQQGGYATDPNYASKLAAVADRLDAALKTGGRQPLASSRAVSIDSAGGDAT